MFPYKCPLSAAIHISFHLQTTLSILSCCVKHLLLFFKKKKNPLEEARWSPWYFYSWQFDDWPEGLENKNRPACLYLFPEHLILRASGGNCLVVQWLRLCASIAGGAGLMPSWGTRSQVPTRKSLWRLLHGHFCRYKQLFPQEG